MTPTRRGFLTGLTSSLILSPAVIRVADLMPIKPFWLRTVDDLPWKPHPLAKELAVIEAEAERTAFIEAEAERTAFLDRYISQAATAMQARVNLGNGKMVSVLKGSLFYSNGRDTYEVGVFDNPSGNVDVHGPLTGPEVIRMIERGGV